MKQEVPIQRVEVKRAYSLAVPTNFAYERLLKGVESVTDSAIIMLDPEGYVTTWNVPPPVNRAS